MTDVELIELLANANQKWHVCDHWDTLHTLAEEVRKLTRELDDWKDSARKAADERCGEDEHHCACVPVLRADLAYAKDALRSACEEVERLRGLVSEMVDLADRDTTSIWELRDSIAGVIRSMRREVRK